jgi:hypothetical protein
MPSVRLSNFCSRTQELGGKSQVGQHNIARWLHCLAASGHLVPGVQSPK